MHAVSAVRSLLAITACAGLSGPAVLPAQTLSAADVAILKHVDEHYNHLRSLRTRYVERYSGMGLTRTEAGTLLLQKPGKMRWTYDTPAGKIFLLDGKTAWFYTPGDPQAQFLPAKKVDDLRTPLRFLLGHTQLQKELRNVHVTALAQGFQIEGSPAQAADKVKQVALTVNTAGLILSMRIEELDGATTEFNFENPQENVATRDADFEFKLPPGVTAVSGLPPV